jgi:hypothetical protein
MKKTTTLCVAGLAVAGLALAGAVVIETRTQRSFRAAHQQWEAELRAARTDADNVRAGNRDLAKQLAQARDEARSLQARLAELEATRTNDAVTPLAPPVVAPYPAAAYLGQSYLGQAWVIPRNFRYDTNAQRYVYEPVIWLDGGLRDRFVTHHTNVVEREVEAAYVNYNYYPQPFYWLTLPERRHRGRDQFPAPPQPPSPPQAPRSPSGPPPPLGGGGPASPFNPGSGVATPQRLGIPAGAITTRPQTLATPPATSP